MPLDPRKLARDAAEHAYNELGGLIRDERTRRLAEPCVTYHTFRLRLKSCPRWRWVARLWLRNRCRVWQARCLAAKTTLRRGGG